MAGLNKCQIPYTKYQIRLWRINTKCRLLYYIIGLEFKTSFIFKQDILRKRGKIIQDAAYLLCISGLLC